MSERTFLYCKKCGEIWESSDYKPRKKCKECDIDGAPLDELNRDEEEENPFGIGIDAKKRK